MWKLQIDTSDIVSSVSLFEQGGPEEMTSRGSFQLQPFCDSVTLIKIEFSSSKSSASAMNCDCPWSSETTDTHGLKLL